MIFLCYIYAHSMNLDNVFFEHSVTNDLICYDMPYIFQISRYNLFLYTY